MQYDIKQLVVFTEVVKQASFSNAAKALDVAQASVSERIANLEKAVGAKLFNRLGRKIEPTATGALLFERAKEILALKNKTDMELLALLGVTHGEVRIGGSTAPGEYLLPEWMGRFAKRHPNVRLTLEIGDSAEIAEKINTGMLDFGMIGKRAPRQNLFHKKVGSDQIILVVGPDHKWAKRRTPVDLGLLSEEQWVARDSGSATRTTAEKILCKMDPKLYSRRNIIAELGSATAVKEAVIGNLGVAFISELTGSRELASGDLTAVRIKGFKALRNFYLVRDKRRAFSAAADSLWKAILDEAS